MKAGCIIDYNGKSYIGWIVGQGSRDLGRGQSRLYIVVEFESAAKMPVFVPGVGNGKLTNNMTSEYYNIQLPGNCVGKQVTYDIIE